MPNVKRSKEVPVSKLRWRCDPRRFKFKTTDQLDPCTEILGQERALRAVRLGLDIESEGYNVFVTGLAGTGRDTTVKMMLEELKEGKTPNDICYVNNFKNPDMPTVLYLKAGEGCQFRSEMDDLILTLRKQIPVAFESDEFQQKRQEIINFHREREKEIVKAFEEKVTQAKFALVQLQVGPYTKPEVMPVIDEKPVALDQLEASVASGEFSAEEYEKLKEKYEQFSAELAEVFKETRKIEKETRTKLVALDREVLLPIIKRYIDDIREKFRYDKVEQYLVEVQESILGNIDLFRGKEKEKEQEQNILGMMAAQQGDPFLEYKVNLLVDNCDTKGAPIVFETNPVFKNIFGTIERVWDRLGQWRTDFTKIKAGSFLRANNGYLVLNALDALVEPGVWQGLKRCLKTHTIEIQSFDPFYMFTTSGMKPEAIETKVKVVMIGDPHLYELLYFRDEDFQKIFKVKADFDTVMDNIGKTPVQYAQFIRKLCQQEHLKPFDRTGVAEVVEYAVRLAGRQKKISVKFTQISDLIREASYWAEKERTKSVTAQHVDKALEEKYYRVRKIEDKIQEMIDEGTIMIDTRGKKVGQVNGLSVYNLGDYSFGKPSRITAETSMGRSGIINIEREAKLSGSTHDKGMLILGGYLRGKYAQDKPLTMSASICFEQSYSGVDGDSASSTEVYALLSSLSGLPLRQDIAVTGSVNQKGEVQPIGGVNQKIEGFFDVCRAKGLTGTQGVLIPHLNINDLMLRKDVVEAVKKGRFHIYAVKMIDEGIEILTGVEAGKRRKNGTFRQGTVNHLVDKQLEKLAQGLKKFKEEESKKKEK
ncbi:MAG: AAA family ATPase [Gemmatimonadota bacterium]|nr:MAG: AAA family ATPase [Gemmatimonadota bacterium]